MPNPTKLPSQPNPLLSSAIFKMLLEPTTKPAQPAPALGATDEGKAQSARRPHVCFTLCRVKLLDWDAKYGVLKDLLDGLVIANLLPGDREDQITGECKQVRVSSYKNEKTIIEITL